MSLVYLLKPFGGSEFREDFYLYHRMPIDELLETREKHRDKSYYSLENSPLPENLAEDDLIYVNRFHNKGLIDHNFTYSELEEFVGIDDYQVLYDKLVQKNYFLGKNITKIVYITLNKKVTEFKGVDPDLFRRAFLKEFGSVVTSFS